MLMLGMSFSVLLLRVWGVVVNARRAGWYARFVKDWDNGVEPGRSRWRVVRRAAIVVGSTIDSAWEFL